jgi:hypothetical protein
MRRYEVHVQNDKGGPLEHDYDLLKSENTIMLTYSNGSQWSKSVRDELVGSLYDDGNDISITLSDREEPIVLDYKQAAELQMLLLANLQSNYVTEIREAKTLMSYTGLSD